MSGRQREVERYRGDQRESVPLIRHVCHVSQQVAQFLGGEV